jgi:hypothetical protein
MPLSVDGPDRQFKIVRSQELCAALLGTGQAKLSPEVNAQMGQLVPNNARLVANIDPSRVEPSSPNVPVIGDVVLIDQGTADDNGMPMSLVYCRNPDGSTRWSALVYDHEIE